jgi:hypothetical protein
MNLTPGPARGSQRFHVAYDIASVIDGTQLSDSRQFIILATVHSLQDRPRIFGAISGRRPEKLRAEVKSASSRSGSNMYPESSAIEPPVLSGRKAASFTGRGWAPEIPQSWAMLLSIQGKRRCWGAFSPSPDMRSVSYLHTATPLVPADLKQHWRMAVSSCGAAARAPASTLA